MKTVTLKSDEIHCESCAARVTKAVSAVSGVENVKVDISSKVVKVTFDAPADQEAIENAMDEAGFEVAR